MKYLFLITILTSGMAQAAQTYTCSDSYQEYKIASVSDLKATGGFHSFDQKILLKTPANPSAVALNCITVLHSGPSDPQNYTIGQCFSPSSLYSVLVNKNLRTKQVSVKVLRANASRSAVKLVSDLNCSSI